MRISLQSYYNIHNIALFNIAKLAYFTQNMLNDNKLNDTVINLRLLRFVSSLKYYCSTAIKVFRLVGSDVI